MSRSTESDICFNVADLGELNISKMAYEALDNSDEDDGEWHHDIGHGWHVVGEAAKAGKKNRLYAWELTKGDHLVHIVNSAFYSNGGAIWNVIFSSTKEATQQFLEDFKREILDANSRYSSWDFSIEDMDSVEQTL